MKALATLLGALALSGGVLLASPAQAAGQWFDVHVIDRDSGSRLPLYRHDGQWWVAGRPGARYAIELRNTSGTRLLGVVSVDGVNVISGETADWQQSGYVLAPHQRAQITGWRKSEAEVAAFHFTALPHAYATRTGRPEHVGVIGVAVFRERTPAAPAPEWSERRRAPAAGEAPPSPAAPAAAAADSESGAASRREAQAAAPRLGTGHGAREPAWVTRTRFERRSSQPDEVIAIRYDSRENLLAMGVIPQHPRQAQAPRPFPDAPPGPGYTPDPPAWR